MLKKHCFVFDSSIGIGSEKYPNVFVVPLIINQKNKDYVETLRDGVDISISKISSLQVAGVNFSTSAANPSDVMALFDHLVKEYENIWVFPIPKLLSETGNNVFRLIASEYQNIKVIDSYTVALMSEWQAQDLIALNNAKKVTEENILAIVNHYKEKIGAPLIVPDLSFLVKGGRISRTKGFIGKLLKIIAVASFDREGVSFRDKTFDINELPKICDKYYETIINNIDWTKIKRIAYLEGTNNDKFKTEQIKEKMLNYYGNKITSKLKIETGKLPAVISVHTGPHYFAFVIEAY